MTRKRVRESIGAHAARGLRYCDGQGFVKTKATTVAYEIFREIRREAPSFQDPTLVVNCHAEVARMLQGEEREELRHLMDRYNKSIQVKAQPNYHREQYDIYGRQDRGGEKEKDRDDRRRGGRGQQRAAPESAAEAAAAAVEPSQGGKGRPPA